MFFEIFILIVIFQRIFELWKANQNRKILLKGGAVEYDISGYKFIILFHILFFCSLVIEFTVNGKFNSFSLIFLIIFILAQILRYWAIFSLGNFWNTRILVIQDSSLILKGPYKYIRHPNYLAVIVEIFSIPLIFSLYFTCIIFSISNLFIILRRIKIENAALGYLRA